MSDITGSLVFGSRIYFDDGWVRKRHISAEFAVLAISIIRIDFMHLECLRETGFPCFPGVKNSRTFPGLFKDCLGVSKTII